MMQDYFEIIYFLHKKLPFWASTILAEVRHLEYFERLRERTCAYTLGDAHVCGI